MRFDLVSEWHLAATPEAVWRVLEESDAWPQWWPEVRRVELLTPGGDNDEGAVRRTWWTSRLPYGFVIDFVTRAAEKPQLLVVEASGDLAGMGRWEIAAIPVGTRVRYVWQVHPHKGWMRWLAPLLAPLFAWNHHAVMRDGAAGMAHRLGVELIDYRKGHSA
ncbi:MAG: SRPBCC family protein [Pseudomonadota bacterium]